jgi:hypothetical protein
LQGWLHSSKPWKMDAKIGIDEVVLRVYNDEACLTRVDSNAVVGIVRVGIG